MDPRFRGGDTTRDVHENVILKSKMSIDRTAASGYSVCLQLNT